MVNAVRNKRVQIHDVLGAGYGEQGQLLHGGVRVQNHVQGGLDREGHDQFRDAHHGDQQNAESEQRRIGTQVAQQAPDFVSFRKLRNMFCHFRQFGWSLAEFD